MSDIEYPKIPAIENGSATDNGELAPVVQSKKVFGADENETPEDKKSPQDTKSPKDDALRKENSAPRTDQDGDIDMDDNAHRNNRPATENNDGQAGSSGSSKKPSRRDEKNRKVVTRVLNCSDLDYYGILEVSELAKVGEIRKAFRDLSLLTHPDKNKMPDAAKAFRKIATAYQVLSDKGSRKQYDANRDSYKFSGELDPMELFGEEFGPGAWDDDSDDSASSEDDLGDETTSTPKPDKFRQDVYKDVTPHVLRFLADHKDSYSEGKIDEFNRMIDAQNQKENITDKEAFFISTRVFQALSKDVATALSFLKKNPGDEEWLKKLVNLEDQLNKTKRVNSYPAEWVLDIPVEFRTPMKQLKGKLDEERIEMKKRYGSGGSGSKNKGQGKKNEEETSFRGNGGPSSSSRDKGKGRADETSTGANGEPSTRGDPANTNRAKPSEPNKSGSAQASDAVDKWQPGLTEKGEKILAMAPFEVKGMGKVPVMTRCKFVVLKKNRTNPIAFEDSFDLGDRATQGYLEEMPKSEQVDIRSKKHDYSPRDRKGFVNIIGVTPEPSDDPRRFPSIALAAKYDHGTLVANRSSWRDIWGSKADRMIEDFFVNHGLELPWEKRAKRPGSTRGLELYEGHPAPSMGTSRSTRPQRSRDLDRVSSVRVSDRRRSLSRNSNSSFLSDEGLERLETVERKIEGLAGMEKRLMQSQDNFLQAMTANMQGLMAQMASVRV